MRKSYTNEREFLKATELEIISGCEHGLRDKILQRYWNWS